MVSAHTLLAKDFCLLHGCRRALLLQAGASSQKSLHICTNKTCRRQGAPQVGR